MGTGATSSFETAAVRSAAPKPLTVCPTVMSHHWGTEPQDSGVGSPYEGLDVVHSNVLVPIVTPGKGFVQ